MPQCSEKVHVLYIEVQPIADIKLMMHAYALIIFNDNGLHSLFNGFIAMP